MLLTPRVLDGLFGVLKIEKLLKIQNILIPSIHQSGVIMEVGIP